MMDDWTPLPPSEKKEAEKKFNKDKELLDRAYMRGQFTQEYYLSKISELIVRYGLAPPEWTADESLELDLELDILEHEMEEKAWEPLAGEEREKAEKKLLKEKKFLNKAFKLGKITQENCVTRVKEVEILLGLMPPEETPEPEQEAPEEDWDTGAVGGEAGYEEESAEEPVEEAP
ncbi:MAG: hypothetical protein KAX31_01820, partial [Thermoplasmata archaeon]|nr:hypothetical protein [Thermoplasmata archaeon]